MLKNKIEKVTGNKIKSIPVNRTSIYDIPYFLTEIKAVKKLYNWSPKKNINNILNDIYNWQVQNYKLLKKYLNEKIYFDYWLKWFGWFRVS